MHSAVAGEGAILSDKHEDEDNEVEVRGAVNIYGMVHEREGTDWISGRIYFDDLTCHL